MNVSIIIVNYNTSEILRSCLQSLYSSTHDKQVSFEVLVVDNASKDGSGEMVKREFPKVHLIQNKKNVGFAKANNQAMNVAHGSNLLLLNSDTILPNGFLSSLLTIFNEDKSIGVLGCQLRNGDGSIQFSCGFFPHFLKVVAWMFFIDDIPLIQNLIKPYHIDYRSFYNKKHAIDWVTGASFMIRRNIVDKVSGMDESLFMYGEEVEWCYRIKKAGFQIWYTPHPFLYHLKGSSGEGKYAGIIQEVKSVKYFYKKYKPYHLGLLLHLVIKFGALLRLVLFGIIGGNSEKAALYAQILSMA